MVCFLLSWCSASTETTRLIRDGERKGSGTAVYLLLSWCFTLAESTRLVRDGERGGMGSGTYESSLFRTAVQTVVSEVHKLFRTGGVPHLLNSFVLAVAT